MKQAERLRIAKKMFAGTVQPADFPDIEEDTTAATPSAPAASGGQRSFLQRVGDLFTGGPKAAAAAPADRQRPNVQAPEAPMDQSPIERARLLVRQLRRLPPQGLEGALREPGHSDEGNGGSICRAEQ